MKKNLQLYFFPGPFEKNKNLPQMIFYVFGAYFAVLNDKTVTYCNFMKN